jgi:hypothetical protein
MSAVVQEVDFSDPQKNAVLQHAFCGCGSQGSPDVRIKSNSGAAEAPRSLWLLFRCCDHLRARRYTVIVPPSGRAHLADTYTTRLGDWQASTAPLANENGYRGNDLAAPGSASLTIRSASGLQASTPSRLVWNERPSVPIAGPFPFMRSRLSPVAIAAEISTKGAVRGSYKPPRAHCGVAAVNFRIGWKATLLRTSGPSG